MEGRLFGKSKMADKEKKIKKVIHSVAKNDLGMQRCC